MKPPLPGDDLWEGETRLTVVASVLLSDDPDRPEEWTVLLLRPVAPYFLVATVIPRWEDNRPGWQIRTVAGPPISNIVPAVEQYKQWGGDY